MRPRVALGGVAVLGLVLFVGGIASAMAGGATCYGTHQEKWDQATGTWSRVPNSFQCYQTADCPTISGVAAWCAVKNAPEGNGWKVCVCKNNSGFVWDTIWVENPPGSGHGSDQPYCDELGHGIGSGGYDQEKCSLDCPPGKECIRDQDGGFLHQESGEWRRYVYCRCQ